MEPKDAQRLRSRPKREERRRRAGSKLPQGKPGASVAEEGRPQAGASLDRGEEAEIVYPMDSNGNRVTQYTLLSAPLGSGESLQKCRHWSLIIARRLGLEQPMQSKIASAVVDVARNALHYSARAQITFSLQLDAMPQALRISVEDEGPIMGATPPLTDREGQAVVGLGFGLPGSKAASPDFNVEEKDGGGSVVSMVVALPGASSGLNLEEASAIRDTLIREGEIDPIALLKRQNDELVASLQTIGEQKRVLAEYNAELRRSEKRQRALTAKLHAILDNLPDCISLFTPSGELEYQNAPAATLAESSESKVPLNLRDHIDRALFSGVDYCPSGKEGVVQVKVGREDHFFLPRVVSLQAGENGDREVLLALRDITEFQLLDDLKSDMLGTVSHEIKGPVTAIRMAVMLLKDEGIGELNEEQAELVETAKEEIERLLRTLNNLLDVRRYSEGTYQLLKVKVHPGWILARCVAEMRRNVESRGLILKAEAADESMPWVCADKERIVYVLNNLVSNAIKHSETGNEIRLAVTHEERGGRVRFSVADDGCGIPKQYQGLIFNRYAKVPGNTKPGAGLGLAIAREFVQAHAGTIGVESEPGKGSEFYFDLPVGWEDAEGEGDHFPQVTEHRRGGDV